MLSPLISTILWVILELLELYWWVVIAAVIASWLVAFNVVNVANQLMRSLLRLLDALTDPLFRQIRRVIPPIGGLDLSPLVVLLAIQALRMLIVGYAGYLY